MILADTSVWVDHLRSGDEGRVRLLEAGRVVCHPYVAAEIALGSLRDRAGVLGLLEGRRLHGRGFVDVSLLTSCLLVPGTRPWTRDHGLDGAAASHGLAEAGPPAA